MADEELLSEGRACRWALSGRFHAGMVFTYYKGIEIAEFLTVSVKVIDGRSKLNALRRSLVRRGSAAAPICSWRTGLRHSQYLPRWRSENSTTLTGEGAADLEFPSPAASSTHRKIALFSWDAAFNPKKIQFFARILPHRPSISAFLQRTSAPPAVLSRSVRPWPCLSGTRSCSKLESSS